MPAPTSEEPDPDAISSRVEAYEPHLDSAVDPDIPDEEEEGEEEDTIMDLTQIEQVAAPCSETLRCFYPWNPTRQQEQDQILPNDALLQGNRCSRYGDAGHYRRHCSHEDHTVRICYCKFCDGILVGSERSGVCCKGSSPVAMSFN